VNGPQSSTFSPGMYLSAGYDPILPWILSNVPFQTTWHLHDQVLSDIEPIQTQEGQSGNCNMSVRETLALGIAWELGGYRFVPQPVNPSASPPPVLLSLLCLTGGMPHRLSVHKLQTLMNGGLLVY
jgi:hypothetical protein